MVTLTGSPRTAPRRRPAGPTRLRPSNDDRAPLLLRITSFALFFFPSSMIIQPIGAAGTVPMMLACALFVLWLLSWIWGLHRPVARRHPGRLAIGVFALAFAAAYIAFYGGWSADPASIGSFAAADRLLILIIASMGLILFIGDALDNVEQVMSLVRWLLAGGFFCSLVGLVQFTFQINPMEWIEAIMPGFTYNGGDTPFQARGNLLRVAGSTFHSIEFAVVSVMLLPLSVWRLIYDRRGSRWVHVIQTALLVFAVASTVTRSGVLGLAVAFVVFVPFLPRVARRWALAIIPVAVVALFALVPGFVTSITGALSADTSDPSIATRVNNYPRVAALIDLHPWLGLGPGNYVPDNALEILDNQYLGTWVSMGAIGLIGLLVYLLLPTITGIYAARKAPDERQRALAAAVAAGMAAAAVCSIAFDSLSFPTFALLYPLFVGISGSIWRLTPGKADFTVAPPALSTKGR